MFWHSLLIFPAAHLRSQDISRSRSLSKTTTACGKPNVIGHLVVLGVLSRKAISIRILYSSPRKCVRREWCGRPSQALRDSLSF